MGTLAEARLLLIGPCQLDLGSMMYWSVARVLIERCVLGLLSHAHERLSRTAGMYCCTAGLAAAVKQLTVVARTLVWLLHTANPQLLAPRWWGDGRPHLQVVGVAAVLGRIPLGTRLKWEQQLQGGVDVGCPGLHVRMQLQIKGV